jgi:hypothetical protein
MNLKQRILIGRSAFAVVPMNLPQGVFNLWVHLSVVAASTPLSMGEN